MEAGCSLLCAGLYALPGELIAVLNQPQLPRIHHYSGAYVQLLQCNAIVLYSLEEVPSVFDVKLRTTGQGQLMMREALKSVLM
jgi:hypothetical protein